MLQAFSYTTSLTLEVRDVRSAAVVANPLCSASLCHLKLSSTPPGPRNGFSADGDFSAWARGPHTRPFATGLASATKLTCITLVNCPAALDVIVPSCRELRKLELLSDSEQPMRRPSREALAVLSRASNLHTLRCHLSFRAPWGALLPDLARLPNLRSLGWVGVKDAAVLQGLVSMTQLTELVVRWEMGGDLAPYLSRLSRLSRLEALEMQRESRLWYSRHTSDVNLAIAIRALPQLQSLCLRHDFGRSTLEALLGLVRLTALELPRSISIRRTPLLVRPWTSRLQRLSLSFDDHPSEDDHMLSASQQWHMCELASSLTSLEDLKLEVSLPAAWSFIVSHLGLFTRLRSLRLQGPGACHPERWKHFYRKQRSNLITNTTRQVEEGKLPAIGHVSRLTRLTRLVLNNATEAREAMTDVPALAALTNLQVVPACLPACLVFGVRPVVGRRTLFC